MSVRQIDSLIRFSESVKTLRERFDLSIKEASTFKSLWQSEKEARVKDAADYRIILEGYAAIESSQRIEIANLTRKYKGQVRKNRVMFIIAIAGVGFGLYQTFLK